ncbi:MAG: TerB family tellurite resistance protein [Cyclobacteriaceae bacterium]|nr:TerB family tellurite resistance protein [Cyclobacteriaceae bacterium SS2]
MVDNIKAHLQSLVQLALADHKFDREEQVWIYSIGKANKVKEKDIDDLIKSEMAKKSAEPISFSALSFDERFEYLYNLIQLMKIDNEVFLSEINYCEGLADMLGFQKAVVKKLSARIYSDPSITSDRELLKKQAKTFEK